LTRGAPAPALALALLLAAAGCPKPPHRAVAKRPERPAGASGAPAAAASGGSRPGEGVPGIVHVVAKGETIYRIARTYGLTPQELADANRIRDPRALEIGDALFVPGATRRLEIPPAPTAAPAGPEPEPVVARAPRPAPAPGAAGDGAPAPGPRLAWPLRGVVYSKFGPREGEQHAGIDIAAPEGTLIGAAAAGQVVFADVQNGYGSMVILRHDDGLLTIYAHASELLVRKGDAVERGAPIARVGQSGRTTGPHLHFEVREGTKARDPLKYLR
jgi:murein DD-endopeptidase MepM/ murein hydrolase activator NlpD